MTESGRETQFEELYTAVPGPLSRDLLALLERHEARGVTHVTDDYPIVWQSALGANVWDVDGNAYLDLTSAFGVANVGHTNPYVAAAIADQAVRLIHGMGDVHPSEVKIRLLERLATIGPPGLTKTYFSTSGADAVEFALKTAYLATGKPRVIAYEGGYHGLSLGTLGTIGIERFREPFAPLLGERAVLLPFPRPTNEPDAGTGNALAAISDAAAANPDVGALLLEPIQGRAGIVLPPPGFLAGLRAVCEDAGLILIFDEIYTGFCRTGPMFACMADEVAPDLLCIGKAMGNGAPISAVLGTPAVMDAWKPSEGEALQTSTYLGNPLACAAALANIDEIERQKLSARATQTGGALGARLKTMRKHRTVRDVRGRGMMWALELESAALASAVVHKGLAAGLILLQSGVNGNVLTIAPPIVIEDAQLARALELLDHTLGACTAAAS